MTPKPDTRITPTADEFDAWCEHPVSRWVAAAYAAAADAQAAQWAGYFTSAPGKDAPPLESLRTELFTRMDAYRAFLQTTHKDYAKLLADQA